MKNNHAQCFSSMKNVVIFVHLRCKKMNHLSCHGKDENHEKQDEIHPFDKKFI
jgi:hypothetical protein